MTDEMTVRAKYSDARVSLIYGTGWYVVETGPESSPQALGYGFRPDLAWKDAAGKIAPAE